MDDIVNELITPTLNQLNEENLPDNSFEGILTPIGNPRGLFEACDFIREHVWTLISSELRDSSNRVYRVELREVEEDSVPIIYWVNEFWNNQLLAAVREASNTQANDTSHTESQLSSEDLLSEVSDSEHQEIPVNSATIIVDETTSRFSGAIWYEKIQKQKIILAGVGGIGSYVAFLLGRLKPQKLIMYDPDKVETVNMSGQLYSTTDVGKFKCAAIAQTLHNYANYYNLITHNDRYMEDSPTADIMICGFDNMRARKVFYNNWKERVTLYGDNVGLKKECLFIDGRLAAEEFQVLSIQGNDDRAMKEYEEKWLFNDDEAEETICSYKQTTFMANMIASVMVNVFVNFVANQCSPIIDRDVPFFISYDASTMFTKVEM